jgi:hypothetical protein
MLQDSVLGSQSPFLLVAVIDLTAISIPTQKHHI